MLLSTIRSIIVPSTWRNVIATSLSCALAGIIVRAAVDPFLAPGFPYPTFWVAADVATVVAGWRAGIITVLIGAGVGWYAWLEPRFTFELEPATASIIVLFVVLAGLQVLLAELMREALLRAEKLREERDLVVRELVHRIRNHFSLFNSIAMQTLRSSADPAAASRALQGRLRALMIGLDLAVTSGEQDFDLGDLVRKIVGPLAPDFGRLEIDAVPAQVPREQVHAVALVLHELGTNAIKYGAWSGQTGAVRVSVRREPRRIHLLWSEDGTFTVPCGNENGFGNVLITRAIPDATVELHPGPPYRVTIVLST